MYYVKISIGSIISLTGTEISRNNTSFLLSRSILNAEGIVLALDGMCHGNQAFAGVICIQNGMIRSIQLEIKDLEVLLDSLRI